MSQSRLFYFQMYSRKKLWQKTDTLQPVHFARRPNVCPTTELQLKDSLSLSLSLTHTRSTTKTLALKHSLIFWLSFEWQGAQKILLLFQRLFLLKNWSFKWKKRHIFGLIMVKLVAAGSVNFKVSFISKLTYKDCGCFSDQSHQSLLSMGWRTHEFWQWLHFFISIYYITF